MAEAGTVAVARPSLTGIWPSNDGGGDAPAATPASLKWALSRGGGGSAGLESCSNRNTRGREPLSFGKKGA